MLPQAPCEWRHFRPDAILLNVRWYMRHSLIYLTEKRAIRQGQPRIELDRLKEAIAASLKTE